MPDRYDHDRYRPSPWDAAPGSPVSQCCFYGTDCGLRDPFGNALRIGEPKEGPIEVPDPAQFAAEN